MIGKHDRGNGIPYKFLLVLGKWFNLNKHDSPEVSNPASEVCYNFLLFNLISGICKSLALELSIIENFQHFNENRY